MVNPKLIHNDEPFQICKRLVNFSASSSGYTLKANPAYKDGDVIDESEWSVFDLSGGNGQIAADTPATFEVVPNGIYRLVGNTDDVYYQ